VIDLGDVCLERHCFSLGNTLYYMMLTLPVSCSVFSSGLFLLLLFCPCTLCGSSFPPLLSSSFYVVPSACVSVPFSRFCHFALSLPRQLEEVLGAARAVVAGYVRRNPLSAGEVGLAWAGAKLRCLTSASMSGATQELLPHDPYVGETERPGWALLDYIAPIPSL
jgi:hypothetical protein